MQPVTLTYFAARGPGAGLTPFQLLDAPDLGGNAIFAVVCAGRYSPALEIGDWTFAIDRTPASASTPPASVLIVKQCSGSLLDNARDLTRWRAIENPFPPEELQAWLLAYIGQAVMCADGLSPSAPYFQSFARLVRDTAWSGSVILNIALGARDTLPPVLSWMGRLIPDGALVAHHIAFTDVATISSATPAPTPVLALASYPALPDDGTGSLFLRAQFDNSALTMLQHTAEPVTVQQA